MTTTTDILVEELEQLHLALANAHTLITLLQAINDVAEQRMKVMTAHVVSQNFVIDAARQLVNCPASGALVCHERLEAAISALDRASA
jgi:hypothetical protein